MSEIDDVAQVKNQGKAERHQHVEGADDEPVGDIDQEKLRHHSPDGKYVHLIREESLPPNPAIADFTLRRPLNRAAGFAHCGRGLVARDDFIDAVEIFRIVLALGLRLADKG